MLAQPFSQIWIQAWQAHSAAGDATATWQACHRGLCALQSDAEGWWHGQLANSGPAPSQVDLLRPLVRAVLPHQVDHLLGWELSSSKGDLAAWLGRPPAVTAAWPAAMGMTVARQLGIRHLVGGATVAACSSGLFGLLCAADHLQHQRCQQAVAGVVDTPLHPMLLGCYRNMGVACRGQAPTAFQQATTGFAPAEGAAALRISTQPGPWRLCGGVRLADASHETRCGDAACLERCLAALWELLPEPDLVITHATGTRAGDAFERAGLDHGPWTQAQRLFCKPVIGHCLGASGLVELCAGLESPAQRLWKISLGFGGHIAAVAVARS